MFLRERAPAVLNELANGFALVTTRCSCNYLSELTAFDGARLDMRLKAITENRVRLNSNTGDVTRAVMTSSRAASRRLPAYARRWSNRALRNSAGAAAALRPYAP